MWKCEDIQFICLEYYSISTTVAFRCKQIHICTNKKIVQKTDQTLPIIGDGGGIRDLMSQEGGLAVLGTIDMGLDSS